MKEIPSIYYAAGTGLYHARIYKNGAEMASGDPNGKSFFPDSRDEEKIIDKIKEAYTDPEVTFEGGNTYVGKTSEGLSIEFYKRSNGDIISAFPRI